METSLFSNALKVCVNEIDNIQEKDEKVGEVLEKIIQQILFQFNYVLYNIRSDEGGFASSNLVCFFAWNAYWKR